MKKIRNIAILTFFLVFTASFLYAQQQSAKNPDLEKWQKYIKDNPGKEEGYLQLGKILDYQGESEKALEYFDKALQINPENPEIFWRKADAFRVLGKEEQAIDLAEQTIQDFPKDWGAFVVLGRIYSERFYSFREGPFDQRKKYLEKALWHLHKAVELDGDNRWAHNLLGILYHHQARYIAKDESEKAYYILSAIKSYKRALAGPPIDTYDSCDDSIECNLGYIYYKHLKDYKKGLDCYKKALEIDPKSEVATFFVQRIKELMRETTTN